MTTYSIQAPDGKTYQIDGPQGATQEQVQAEVMRQNPHLSDAPQGGAAPTAFHAAINGVANGGTFGFMAPIAAALGATTQEGNTSHAPSWSDRYNENLAKYRTQDQQAAQAHPVANISGQIAGGVLNPVTRALPVAKTLGGAIGQGAAVGAGYGAGSALTNQDDLGDAAKEIGVGGLIGGAIPAAIPAAKYVAKKGGQLAAQALGLTTGVGAKPIETAFQAGAAGGDQAQAFASNMRGNTPWTDVVDQAKGALAKLRADRNATYRSGMVDVSSDPAVLSFDPVDKALGDAGKIKTFAGRSGTGPVQDLAKSTATVRGQIQEAIDNWKSLDPAEYHTPEGFDALKQQIGDIKDNLPFGSPQRTVADKAYNAIRKTIADQAPAYNKVMAQYSEASDAIDAIQKELSLGPKGNPGTAMRKLQSIMRDNVNTSYGNRATYAEALKDAGATTLIPSLAGQSMSAALPRGLGRFVGGGELGSAAIAAGMGHPGALLAAGPLLAASSPRLVGEAAFNAGRGAGALRDLPRIIPAFGNTPATAALVPAMLPRLK